MIYLSTGGFSRNTFVETAKLLDSKIVKALELSAGTYCEDLEASLASVKTDYNLALHNYFPVPKEPFVFNLASGNPTISELSMSHAKKSIELSAKFGSKYYSFHAGYLLDPDVNELGKEIKLTKLIDRTQGLKNFIANVNKLADFAVELGVELLIENNVLSLANSQNFADNPLLMVEAKETELIFEQVRENVHLLIDVAHLKVSANSLGFDAVEYLYKFKPITKGYHLSDNNGEADTNEGFGLDAWFIEHINWNLDYYSIEVYEKDIQVLHEQYKLVAQCLEKKCLN